MVAAAVLKNRWNAISPQPFDRFRDNLAWWHVWAFRTLSNLKNHIF